jgi:hypothetical protein
VLNFDRWSIKNRKSLLKSGAKLGRKLNVTIKFSAKLLILLKSLIKINCVRTKCPKKGGKASHTLIIIYVKYGEFLAGFK